MIKLSIDKILCPDSLNPKQKILNQDNNRGGGTPFCMIHTIVLKTKNYPLEDQMTDHQHQIDVNRGI